MSYTKRQFLKTAAGTAALGVLPIAGVGGSRAARAAEPIKLGILHSLTGSIAIAEIGVTEAERLAIDEINAAGGVLGRQLEAIVEDGASDNPTFAEKAQKLLVSDKAAAVFGWGMLVLFVADHAVRPTLIGGATRLPFLWVLLGILGGVESFGLLGLFLGPAVMAVLVLLWREAAAAPPPAAASGP